MAEESKKIDVNQIRIERENNVDDLDILNLLLQDSNGVLSVNDETLDLQKALDAGVSTSDLLDYLTSGKTVRKDIDSQFEANMNMAATGLTNVLGLPGDLLNMIPQVVEGGVRAGANKLASLNPPEGVDDPNSPNYDPDFYLSTNPKDFLFSSEVAPFGSQNVRRGIEKVANVTTDPVANLVSKGVNTTFGTNFDEDNKTKYVDDIKEIPDEYRTQAAASRVVAENALPAVALLKAVKAGFGLANPLMQSIKKDPKKFIKGEAYATTGSAIGASTVEAIGAGDNPYAVAGGEILGALAGNVSPTVIKNLPGIRVVSGIFKQAMKGVTTTAAQQGAYQQILVAADASRQSLLREADLMAKNGNTEMADALRLEADKFTPERMQSDIETQLALEDANPLTPDAVKLLPAGTVSNNPTLLALQKTLMGESPQFGGEIMQRANNAITGIFEVSEILARAGNTAAADSLRTRAYSAMIDARMATSSDNVAEAMKSIKGTGDQAAASALAQKTLFQAKTNIREMETFLWNRIDKNQILDGKKISEAIDGIYANNLLDGMRIAGGDEIDTAIDILNQKIKDGQGIPVGEILKFRSIMLSNSRKFGANNDYFHAGLFDELAGASIDELNKLQGAAGDTVGLARNFSLELNKRFNRYFTKDILSTEKTGGTTVRDTDVLSEGFGAGGRDAGTNFGELRDATQFADDLGPDLAVLRAEDEARRKASTLGDDGTRTSNTEVATNEGLLYPENTSYPIGTQEGDGFVIIDGKRVFPPDGRRGPKRQFSDDVVDAEGNPISKEELPDGVTDQERLDEMFNRPEGATYSRSGPETATDDFKLNEGGQSADKTALTTEADNLPLSLGDEMSAAQEDFLRSKIEELAGKNVDGTQAELSAEAIEAFVSKNSDLLDEFPDLRNNITLLYDARRTANKLIEDLSSAANEKLPEAIGKAIDDANPVESFSRLADEAITIDAKIDFRNATMDELFRGATKPDGSPDLLKISERLLKPLSGRKGDTNILDTMVNKEIMGPQERDAILNMLAEGLRIEKGLRDPAVFNKVMSDTPDIQKNIARIAGANIGVLFGTGNASLQAAAIGSAAFKKFVDQFPLGKQVQELTILLKQPRLLAAMLDANPTISRSGFQAAKEYLIIAKELGIKGTLKAVGKGIVEGTANKLSTLPMAYPGAIVDSAQGEETPSVSVQMQDAFP